MYLRIAITVTLASIFLLTTIGCVTSDGSSGGWVVVDQPGSAPPPPPARKPPPAQNYKKSNKGPERAASNHIRSAYRFLAKNKPDHALRELEKARDRAGAGFWIYYYRGGAYYFKGMYEKANDSWRTANRYTKDPRLISRLRTCQSYAIHHLGGEEKSIGFLKRAIEMDKRNREARELLNDLDVSMKRSSERKQEVQVGFMRPSDSRSDVKSETEDRERRNRNFEDDEDRDRDDDGDADYGRSKNRKGQDKDDRKHGKPDKKKKKSKKIRDKERFREYFLIEMG